MPERGGAVRRTSLLASDRREVLADRRRRGVAERSSVARVRRDRRGGRRMACGEKCKGKNKCSHHEALTRCTVAAAVLNGSAQRRANALGLTDDSGRSRRWVETTRMWLGSDSGC